MNFFSALSKWYYLHMLCLNLFFATCLGLMNSLRQSLFTSKIDLNCLLWIETWGMFKSVHDISEKLSIFSHHMANKTEGSWKREGVHEPGPGSVCPCFFLTVVFMQIRCPCKIRPVKKQQGQFIPLSSENGERGWKVFIGSYSIQALCKKYA